MVALFSLSSIHGDASATPAEELLAWIPPGLQNLLHVPIWAGLAACWAWALERKNHRLWLTATLSIGYGIIDELYQRTVPGRYGSFTDLLFDAIGVMAVVLLIAYLKRKQQEEMPAEKSST